AAGATPFITRHSGASDRGDAVGCTQPVCDRTVGTTAIPRRTSGLGIHAFSHAVGLDPPRGLPRSGRGRLRVSTESVGTSARTQPAEARHRWQGVAGDPRRGAPRYAVDSRILR